MSVIDLGYAQLDIERLKRRGVGEVIFGEGKSIDQLVEILWTLYQAQGRALATRVKAEYGEEVLSRLHTHLSAQGEADRGPSNPINTTLEYDLEARCLTLSSLPPPSTGRGEILILTAGTSDGAVAAEAERVLKFLGHEVTRINDVGVAGLHRLLAHLDRLRTAEVIITCAGMEGALASVVAGLVDCPVIAVPTSVGYGAHLGGVATLLSMLNSCAAGVVVVNIDNGFGAAYAAAQINRSRVLEESPSAEESIKRI